MTLNEFSQKYEWICCVPADGSKRWIEAGEAVQVFSQRPELWLLDDYKVSSAVSGQSVILVPVSRNHR